MKTKLWPRLHRALRPAGVQAMIQQGKRKCSVITAGSATGEERSFGAQMKEKGQRRRAFLERRAREGPRE